jgi:hypothetical protein
MAQVYRLKAKVWLYPGDAAWHFVNVDKTASAAIKKSIGRNARGFGSVPVSVLIGKTTWETLIFPDKRSGTYLLPLKAEVRRKKGLAEGDAISFSLCIR